VSPAFPSTPIIKNTVTVVLANATLKVMFFSVVARRS